MIHKVEMYAATCDNCGENWEHTCGYSCMNDEQSVLDGMGDWHVTEDEPAKHYCPKCFFAYQDEDGEDLVDIRIERNKELNDNFKTNKP